MIIVHDVHWGQFGEYVSAPPDAVAALSGAWDGGLNRGRISRGTL